MQQPNNQKPGKLDPATIIGTSLDTDPAFYVPVVWERFKVRWKLFLACAIITPAIALFLAHQIPSNYESTAQLLIKHSGSSISLYGDFTTPIVNTSAASSAEILRSSDVVSQMVKIENVTSNDIARPAYKILFGKVAALIMPLFGRDYEDNALKSNPDLIYTILAKDLKSSIDAKTLLPDRANLMSGDELIEVTLKSTNREKVAAMVNTLCEIYIDHSNHIADEEISSALNIFAEQAKILQEEIDRLRTSSGFGVTSLPSSESTASNLSRPLSYGLAVIISELELELVKLRQNFKEDSIEIVEAKAELEQAHKRLADQEAIDAAREQLRTVTKRQRELQFAAKIMPEDRSLVSIVEKALTPKKTKLTTVVRYGVPGAAGLIGGIGLAVFSIIALNLLDPRLFVESDIEYATGQQLLGVIKTKKKLITFDNEQNLPHPEVRPALQKVLSKIDASYNDGSLVIAVGSANNEASSSIVSLQLAGMMARNVDNKVLLVDANFDSPELSENANLKTDEGLLSVLSDPSKIEQAIISTALPRLAFLSCGPLQARDETGASQNSWRKFIEYARSEYTVIILNAGGFANSREAAPLAQKADHTILVANRKASTKQGLRESKTSLEELGVNTLGVIYYDPRG